MVEKDTFIEDVAAEMDAKPAPPPRLDWTQETRTKTIEQKVKVSSLRFTEDEVETIIKNYVHSHYLLSYSNHEVKVSLLNTERSEDAAIVQITTEIV